MEFNVAPYNDDFQQNAKDNNYLKILFKPGFSVQARELTQIQSILQNQIKSFGDHIFQDGSPVIGGNIALDNTVTYLLLDETYNNEDIEPEDFVGKIILRDSDSLVQAKVLASYFPSGGLPTLMIKYISGVDFSEGDVFKIAGTTTRARIAISDSSRANTATPVNPINKGTIASINDGIFYVDGYFVTVLPQTTVVAAYSQKANVKIGLEVNDEVIDYTIDSTLLDPAQDSFNYQAPGADRYQFQLNLSTRPLETAVDESKFFELMRVENGAITKQVKYPIYSEIEKTLARRTFDESGDYTVVPFRASIGESQNTSNYIINIEPGKAYVKGFEFETIGTVKMEVEKPREDGIDTRSIVDIDFDTSYGNYLKFRDVRGNSTVEFIDTTDLSSVDLHCVPVNKVNVGIGYNSNTFVYQNTKIGTARVRALRRDIPGQTDANTDNDGVFDFYFTDINIQPRIFKIDSGTSTTVTLPVHTAFGDGAYVNTTITVLPIQLTTVSADINKANTRAGSVRVNANSTATFTGNVSVGDIIRVGDEVRQVVTVATDYLLVNSAFTKTFIGTGPSNPLSVFKQTDYSSNVTGQTRRITGYVGSTRVATLDRAWDENAQPASGTVIQMNFSVADLECLIKPNTSATLANAHANISVQSTLLDGSTEMFEPSDKKLIFRLPQNTVKKGSLQNVEYRHQKYYQVTGTSGAFTLPLVGGQETRPWAITNSNIEDNLLVVIRSSANAYFTPGSIPKLNVNNVVEGVGSVIVNLPSDVTTIDAYMIVQENSAEDRKREKTFRSNTSLTTSPWNYPQATDVSGITVNVPNVGDVAKINVANGLIFITEPKMTNIYPGDSISLYVPDVVNVRAILKGNSTMTANATVYEDITDWFVVDLGQTEEMYDHAKITLKQGYPSPNAQLTIHVDFYEHTYPTGASFFSVDSYENSIYENGQIPVYFSEKEGAYFLRDCLDFRPTRRIGLTDGTLDTGLIPDPNSTTGISFDYYLPRIDKLVLSKNKEFRVLKGISSPTPIPPEDTDDAMTLYTIYLPAFVASTEEIRLRYNENRRYTMKDISRIDKRVQSLEYYTALNNIEGMALADSSKYEDGTDKAKFGIIGEGFKNFNIADYKDPDFNCSMEEGEMGPYVGHVPFNMRELSMSGLRKNDRTVTLEFTEEPMVVQPVTSNKLVSVQPFLFAQFIGDVKLSPEMDYWVSEELKPDVLRAPEIDSRIREIYNSERAAERVIEPPVQVTVPTPTTNASSLISFAPGEPPPGGNSAFTIPVVLPPPPPLVPTIPFTPPSRNKKKKRSIFDNIKLLFPVVNAPAPAPIPPTPSTPLPVYTAPVTATRTLSGGGGCVVLESYIPEVEGQVWNFKTIKQAYQLQPEFKLWLADETSLEVKMGSVRKIAVEVQPCVRVRTSGGVSLVCSTTAPLPTLRGIVLAPDVKGEKVAVYKDGMTYWETVDSVDPAGDKYVAVIDAHNTAFWAGEHEGAYILHHNMAIERFNVNKV